MSQFKYLLFDADETLFDFKQAERHGISETLRQVNGPVTQEIIDEYHAYNDSLWKALERGEITKAALKTDRFRHLIEKFDIRGTTPEEMAAKYEYNLAQGCYLLPGAKEVLATLSDKYHCSIVTNGIAYVQHTRFDASGLQPYIKHLFISDEMGVQKPAARFFQMVLEQLGAEPQECLVIGDSLSSDMLGAYNAGLPKCLYNRTGKSHNALFPNEYEIHSLEELYDIL